MFGTVTRPRRAFAAGSPGDRHHRRPACLADWLCWLEAHAFAVSLVLIAVATIRVALTYPVFSHTIDEPAHIACGLEWLDKKTYTLEHLHPPLARVMTALGPYLAGERSGGHLDAWGRRASDRVSPPTELLDVYREGVAILHGRNRYDWVLALARMGTLPFLWIGSLVVFAWSRRLFGGLVAIMAVFLFTQVPSILAHSGLATTDMAVAALVGAAAYTALVWLEKPSLPTTVVAGGVLGLAVLSKFSSLLFVPVALATIFGWYVLTERPSLPSLRSAVRSRWPWLLLGLAVAALVVWGGYRFSFGRVQALNVRLPAPELYSGVAEAFARNTAGHPTYLLGRRSQFGWWYFFPVALSVKTPLPFLFLALGSAVVAIRRKTPARWPLAYCLGVLFCVMPSRLNLGSRHVLAIYLGLAILAAPFAVEGLRGWSRNRVLAAAVAGSLIWLMASAGFAHPDYLAYFNALAGREPERVLVHSDLDWGQDLKRLAKRLQEVGASEVAIMPPGSRQWDFLRIHLDKLGFPAVRDFDPLKPSPGWNAVSLTTLKLLYDERSELALWPEVNEPRERVGSGILLYYFPPSPVGDAR